MNAVKMLIDITVVCFELFILLTFYGTYMEKIKDKKTNIIICITYLMLMYINGLIPHLKPYLPLIAYVLTFLVTLLYKSNKLYKLVLSTIIFITLWGMESLIGLALVLITKMELVNIQKNIFLYLLGIVFSKLLVYIVVKLINYKKKSKEVYFSVKSILPLILLLISVCILIYIVYYTAYNLTNQKVIIPMVIGILLFIFSNISVLYILEGQTKTELKNQKLTFMSSQFDNQLKHYDELYKNQKETYKIWHDMNKQLMAVTGLMKTGQNELAYEYINKLVGNVNGLVNIVNTGYPILDSIIRLNQNNAISNNIKFEYKVKVNDNEINIDKMDVAIIVGNALDNALEACKNAKLNNKYISLLVYNTDKDFLINVENSTTNVIKNTNLIKSTKNRNQKYGFGINTIKSIAKNYNGNVDIVCKNNVFYLSVVLEI